MIAGILIGRMFKKKVDAKILFLLALAGERVIIEAYKIGRARMPAKFELGEWGQKKCCSCKPLYS